VDQALLRAGNAAAQTSTKALQMTPDAAFATGQAIADINEPFEAIVEQVAKALAEVGYDNAEAALRQLGIKDPAILNEAKAEIAKWAKDRAASMVGKQWLNGVLAADPEAHWPITDLTEEGIGKAVSNVLEAFTEGEIDEIDTARMTEELLSQYAFSSERSALIADNESRRAATKGHLAAWRASGVVTGKYVILSPEHEQPCACDEAESYGVVDLDSNFNGLGFGPAFHPRCLCVLGAVRANEDLDVDYLDELETGGKATTIRPTKAVSVFDLTKDATIFGLARSIS
jgi:hypothetical protein